MCLRLSTKAETGRVAFRDCPSRCFDFPGQPFIGLNSFFGFGSIFAGTISFGWSMVW